MSSLLLEAGFALGIGLFVGLEREHHDLSAGVGDGEAVGDGAPAAAREVVMGARTFALLALIGWLLAVLGDHHPWALPAGLIVIGAVLIAQVVSSAGALAGLTTEAAAVVVLLLGLLVHHDRELAVGLALATTLLLVSKPWMRAVVVRLRRVEVSATVQLLVLVAIVLPILPTAPIDPWGALPPRKIGIFVVLIAAVEYVGYVLTRVLGARRGTGVAGLVGGLSSSTAVTVSMARRSRESAALVGPAQLAVLLANTVMCVRVIVISAVLSTALGWQLGAALGAMALVLLVGAVVIWLGLRRADGDGPVHAPVELTNPFALIPALTWGAIMCAVLVAARLSTDLLGERGLLVAAAVSGFVDVDAITLAAGRQAEDGTMSVSVAALAIAIAVAANSAMKIGMAFAGGGRRFGVRVAIVLGLGTVVAAAIGVAGVVVGSVG